ncbi:hypothetical protein EDC04DRAFT_2617387 [Pisolithus marmoratus]|nr:hypothetical protein EDC04DRAFT_2617387 [Pisolithus marmoratus]
MYVLQVTSIRADPSHVSLESSQACLQNPQALVTRFKQRSQVVTPSSNASPITHVDIKQVIRGVAFEILKTLPTSQQYNQLLSSCATCDPAQQTRLIHIEVSRYFRFVTLSHRWGSGEPLLRDIEGRSIYVMSTNGGFGKLQAFCAIAGEQDYLWAWSDTCCIDKDSSAELQEAIGSMFVWYRRSALTITYLSDVSDTNSFLSSEWFERGWTLQELLAPERLLFYTQTWSLYMNLRSSNHKTDVAVLEELGRATGIESRFLTNFSPGMDDARSRLQWASSRRTTRPEDIAYPLFGIFDIHLPVLYSESAEIALGRLLAEIISQSGDISVPDWVGEASREQLVASLQTLYRSLDKLPLPRFLNRRLTLPCITYLVTTVQLKGTAPYDSSCTYEIQASGLRPFEVALPSKLENQIMSPGVLHVVRPWHSKLLDPYGKPFRALLLIELPHNEYKRIASSTPIIAQPVNEDSILKSGVKTLDIV